jgi:hypothetical protein
MAAKRKSIDAGSVSNLKRSRDVFSISEKVRILDMMEIEKKIVGGDCQVYGKNYSPIREVMKNKEKISLLYRLLRIKLKRQNPSLSYVREREYTVNVQHSVQCTLLLRYLILVNILLCVI